MEASSSTSKMVAISIAPLCRDGEPAPGSCSERGRLPEGGVNRLICFDCLVLIQYSIKRRAVHVKAGCPAVDGMLQCPLYVEGNGAW